MSNFSSLKAAIQQYIKTNGNEEITGAVLQDILLSMVSVLGDTAINDLETALQTETTNRTNADGTLQQNINNEATARGNADTALGNRLTDAEGAITTINTMLGEGYVYAGIATTSTNPGTPTGKVFYIATAEGTYTNFGGLSVTQGFNILKYNGSAWSVEQVFSIDDNPTTGSPSLVKSGGVERLTTDNRVFAKEALGYLGLQGFYEGQGYIDSGNLFNLSITSSHYIIPINAGDEVLFNGDTTQIAFLKGYVTPKPNSTPEFCDTTPTRIQAINNQVYTAPSDAKFLYFMASYNGARYSYNLILLNGVNLINTINNRLAFLINEDNKLDSACLFNGSSSKVQIPSVLLSQDGDYIEIEYETAADASNSIYSFAQGENAGTISICLTCFTFGVRTTDGVWLHRTDLDCAPNGVIKIAFESGYINSYRNGVLINSYNNTANKTVTISGFGKNSSYPYWGGAIKNVSFKAGSITFNGRLGQLIGVVLTDVDVMLERKYPKFVIVPSSSSVKVYFQIYRNIYGWLSIGHTVNAAAYSNQWRIDSEGNFALYNGQTFFNLNECLLVGAENEFALQFRYSSDFSGGYHGNEKIDADNTCYCVFIVDGEEYSITDLVALGTISCDSFAYRQRSVIYYVNSSTPDVHTKVAYHTKTTTFRNSGFVTRNYLEMDLSDYSESSISITYAFTGLFCVHKNCAKYVIGDDGKVYTASHPTSTTMLVSNLNKCSRLVVMNNGAFSSEMDSRIIGTNNNTYKTSVPIIEIMDRKDDCKYYSYLTPNATVSDGEAFMTEAEIKWNIK